MKKGWKKSLAGIAAVAAVAGSAQVALANTCGDFDNSAAFDLGDCVAMIDTIAGPPDTVASPCGGAGATQCGDLNGDGILNVGDAILCIQNAIAPSTPTCASGIPTTCPGTVNSAITQSAHWGPSGCTVTLDGTIFVNGGVFLKVDPGVTIKGKASPTTDPVSALVFRRDSRFDMQGTASNPIIMTSDEPSGSKTVGGWGGVVFNGRGTVNVPGGEGLAEGLTGVPFGGNSPNEKSGTFSFARVEFAGHVLSLDNELNSVTMNALGRGTDIHHVEALRGKDDGFEWFGGNNFIHHVVSAANNDDNLDTQLGTQGGAQYALIIQQKDSTGGNNGSNGFEADNNENGFDLLPRSNAKFCNITAVGFNQQSGSGTATADGALLRRGTAEQIANTIFTDWLSSAVRINDNATAIAACSGGSLTGTLNIKNSIQFANTALAAGNANGGAGCAAADIVTLFNMTNTDPLLDINLRTFSPPFTGVPGALSPAGTLATLNCKTDPKMDPIFDDNTTAPYIGAFAPGGTDWATGNWISYALN